MSKNAEGWIRHRGGKCPVEYGVKVDYRMRNGSIDDFGRKSETLDWSHDKHGGDIMAYKIHGQAEETADEKVMRDCVEKCASTESVSQLMYDPIAQGPLQWRDRIAEIDATTMALTTERAELVQKLASEGFALIGRVVEPVEDMSDWRNWKAGDQLTTVLENDCNIEIGRIVTLRSIEDPEYDGGMPVSVFYGNEWNWPESQDESGACVFKFHSRPSA